MAKAPPRDGLQRLVQKLSPGGRLVRMRRLRGGLGARMHVLNIEPVTGGRRNFVLRRYLTGRQDTEVARAQKEFRVLQLAASADIPAPIPILLDAERRFFDAPSMILSYLPGRSFHIPRNTHTWASELARGLATVHAVTPERFDLSWLTPHQKDAVLQNIEDAPQRAKDPEPLASEIVAELEKRVHDVDLSNACLMHGDFHPGNTVFAGSRLTGIVDWSEASLGDRRFDVAQCRLDLVVSHGIETADYFQDAYEAATGRHLDRLAFFDLERGLPALYHYKHWLVGYHDAGLTHLTEEAAGERLHIFLRRALNRCRNNS